MTNDITYGKECRRCGSLSVFKDFELPIEYCLLCDDTQLKIDTYLLNQRVNELEAKVEAMRKKVES